MKVKTKHFMTTVLIAVLCFMLFPAMSFAEENAAPEQSPENVVTQAWDGSVDTTWYTSAPESTMSYQISTPAQLAGLEAVVNGSVEGIEANDFSGKMVSLTADLDLGGVKNADGTWSGQSWKPIGQEKRFAGFFNAKNHKISNLYIKSTQNNVGLFGQTTDDANIKNLRIESGYVESTGNSVGAICGYAYGYYENCISRADVKGGTNVGGLFGQLALQSSGSSWTQVKNCAAICDVTVTSANGTGAGIVAFISGSNNNLENIYHIGKVETDQTNATLTGICARAYNSRTITNGYHVGTIQGTTEGNKVTTAPIYESNTVNNCFYSTEDTYTAAKKGIPKTADELKALAETLGDAFTADKDNMNQGYPVLKCMLEDGTSQIEAITVKANHGEEAKGASLQDVIENKMEMNPKSVSFWEVTGGKFTLADKTYFKNFIGEVPLSIIIGQGVDASEAFPDGVDLSVGSSRNALERVEIHGVKAIKRFWNGDGTPTFWMPDAETVKSGAFNSADIITISLPSLKNVEAKGFQYASALKNLVLPGSEVPSVADATAFEKIGENPVVWVPENKVNDYKNTKDNAADDGKWWGLEVKAIPTGCANLSDMVHYYVDKLPAADQMTLNDEADLVRAEELFTGLPYADITNETAEKLTQLREITDQLHADLVIKSINALPAQDAITAANDEQIMKAKADYDALSDAQKALVENTLYQKLLDALLQVKIAAGTPFVYSADNYIGYGDTLKEAIANTGVTAWNDKYTVQTIKVYRGNFPNQDLLTLLKEYSSRQHLIVDEGVNVNDGYLTSGFFKNLGIETVEMPSVKEIQKGAIDGGAYYASRFSFPNVTKISQSAISGTKVAMEAFMPYLEESQSALPVEDQSAMLPRLREGKAVYQNSKAAYAYLPSLEKAGADFFNGTSALKAVWMPSLKTLDGDAFKGSAVTDLYLESAPPEVTGSQPFSKLSDGRTVYVPADLVDTYKTVADDNAKDGKWYGWNVSAIGDSDSGADLLNALIGQFKDDEITIDYSEWIHAIERAAGVLNEGQAALVKTELSSVLAGVGQLEQSDADHVIAQINALGAPEQMSLADASKVAAVRAAYDRLVPTVQSKVTNLDTLEKAEARIEALSIGAVQSAIAKLPKEITEENKAQVRETYADYLTLSDKAKAQITEDETQALNAAIDQVVALEKEILSAQTVKARIDALPLVDQLTITDADTVSNIRGLYDQLSESAKKRVDNLKVLEEAEKQIEILQAEQPKTKTITLSIEKFTLGQGYIQTPIQIEVEEDDNLAAITTGLLGRGNYKNTGTVDKQFYLSGIKDNDTSEANIPQYIKDAVDRGWSTITGRGTTNWLSEFDYTSRAGWMYSVNNTIPQVSCSDVNYDYLNDGDVIRWQFTVFGLGADLGYPSSDSPEPYIQAANKDQLSKKLAEVDASAEKLVWLADENYKAVYDNAYALMENMESSQANVDAATEALGNTPTSGDLGKVTVTVQDIVPRRQETSTSYSDEKEYKELTGLGDYQEPFGVLLDKVEVPVEAGMTVSQAVSEALESGGYSVEGSGNSITGVGPVTTPDRSTTVARLGTKDAGDLSKWVISKNETAISASDAMVYYAEAGDVITLEYSVDGGSDIHCSSASFTNPIYTYDTDVRKSGNILYLPEGTASLSVNIDLKNSYTIKENYSRYHQAWIAVDGRVYKNNEPISVNAGTKLEYNTYNPIGAGGILNSISGSGGSPAAAPRVSILTVDYFKTPEAVIQMIAALPEEIQYNDQASITEARKYYDLLTAEEKARVSNYYVQKLKDAETSVANIKKALQAEAKVVTDQIKALPSTDAITEETVDQYTELVAGVRKAYEDLSADAKTFVSNLSTLQAVEKKIDRLTNPYEAPLGTAVNYPNDFMLTALGFNLNIGDDPFEVVFFDTPRIGQDDQATNRNDLVVNIADRNIVDIEVRKEPNPNNQAETLDHYYLVPKAEGTTTMTATYPEFEGQTPEMVIHVNGDGEKDMANTLTNINEKARKYDCWHFWEGTDGADFSFKVNGSNAKVEVLSYLGKGNDKTYTPDGDGNVTVKLTDGYNPIVVTADINGKTVTQAYGVKAKAIKYTLTNVTDPESGTYKAGDTVSLKVVGLNTPVYKISRIYNPAATTFAYQTDMPRYDELESGGGQYESGAMEFVLTEAGDYTLKDGYVKQSWFGSPLYSELPVGTAPPVIGGAAQPNDVFPKLPDIKIHVDENPQYKPTLVQPKIENGNTVKAGDTVTIQLPTLDIQLMKTEHTTASSSFVNDVIEAYTTFKTDIPGKDMDHIRSEKAQYYAESYYGDAAKDTMDNLKTVTFTVPEDTPSGEYHIGGGYVDTTWGISWWMHYTGYFKGEINDLTIKVIASDKTMAAEIEAQINKLPESITLENEADVTEAKAGYEALTDAQKALVSQETKDKLEKAVQTISDLKAAAELNQYKADAKDGLDIYKEAADYRDAQKAELIKAISDGKAAIDAAKDKASVDAAVSNAKAVMDAIKTDAQLTAEENQAAAKAVIEKINALPKMEELTISEAHLKAVQEARTAYNALSDAQKQLVTNAASLEAAEAKQGDMTQAEAVTRQIERLGSITSLAQKGDVEKARAAYQLLTDSQKGYVRQATVDTLEAAEAAIEALVQAAEDQAVAQTVIDQIEELREITRLEQEGDILAARNAYDQLTTGQKVHVTNLSVLEAAETTLADMKTAKAVTDKIQAIGPVTLESEPAITEAQEAYDKLTDIQKGYVTEDTQKILSTAHAKLAELKQQAADQAAAKAVSDQIAALPEADKLTLEDKETVEVARGAYNALTEAQQKLVSNLEKLEAAETQITKLETQQAEDQKTAQAVSDQIAALPETDKLTLENKDAVEAARKAYDSLSDAQRSYVSEDSLKALETAEAQIAKLEAGETPDPAPTPTSDPTPTPQPGTPGSGTGSGSSGTTGNGTAGAGSNTNTSITSGNGAAVWGSLALVAVAAGITGFFVSKQRKAK